MRANQIVYDFTGDEDVMDYEERCSDVGYTNGKFHKCSMSGCFGIRIHVKWKDGKWTYPCSKCMAYRETPFHVPSLRMSLIGDCWIIGGHPKQQLQQDDGNACDGCGATTIDECHNCEHFSDEEPNYCELAESIVTESGVSELEMPYNWRSADFAVVALTSKDNEGCGLSPERVRELCSDPETVKQILETFGDKIVHDWYQPMADAITEVIEL